MEDKDNEIDLSCVSYAIKKKGNNKKDDYACLYPTEYDSEYEEYYSRLNLIL